jgi:hypothetical protein
MLWNDETGDLSGSYKIAISRNDIVHGFDGNNMCDDALTLFFSMCLMDDDESFRSESIGYRVFVPPTIDVHEHSTYNLLFLAFVSSDSSFYLVSIRCLYWVRIAPTVLLRWWNP